MEPMTYAAFRTGYTYRDIYQMIFNRRHKRRNGVLGFWRELKLKMYAEYLRNFAGGGRHYTPSASPIPE